MNSMLNYRCTGAKSKMCNHMTSGFTVLSWTCHFKLNKLITTVGMMTKAAVRPPYSSFPSVKYIAQVAMSVRKGQENN